MRTLTWSDSIEQRVLMKHPGKYYFSCWLISLLLLIGCGQGSEDGSQKTVTESQPPSNAVTVTEKLKDSWWPQHGLDASEQRFSPLDQINTENINRLGLVWSYDPPVPDDGLAGTPVVVDGVIYMSGTFATVFAIDAVSGEELWFFDPESNLGHGFGSSWAGRRNHGVAVDKGRVYVGTPDCRLIALDAKSGEVVWEVQSCDSTKEYAIAGAPRVAKGKVYIGNGLADFGARGYVTAYDAETGEQIWRFYTVPGDPSQPYENPILEMAAKTWSKGWSEGGGACAWDAIVYDEEYNHIYFGTDSALPWDPSVRSPGGGDNLFLNSIIAVDADTGEYKWHYQTVPADAWDLNAANQIILADLEIDGQERKVLMQAPKNGFFYVIERETGKLLSANNYLPVKWASHVDPETGRPVESAEARYYLNADKRSHIRPQVLGAHNWHAMSYNPMTGLVYIPAQTFGATYQGGTNSPLGGVSFRYYDDNLNEDRTALSEEGKKNARGKLIGWDPVKQEATWSFTHEMGMNGGVVSTAGGLLFQGGGDGVFRAHATKDGEELWQFASGSAIQAGPVSYAVDGSQYVVVPVGSVSMTRIMVPLYGDLPGPTRLLAFKLDGEAKLPPFTPYKPDVPKPPVQTASAEQVRRGANLFEAASCGLCHGSEGVGMRPGGSVPSLQYMSPESHEQFEEIVLGGMKKPMGMMSFKGILSEKEVKDVHAFVIDRQWQLYNLENANE